MKTSSAATGIGSNFSGGVRLSKGTTLNGIMLICSSVVNKKCYSTSLIIFLTHLLYTELHGVICMKIITLLLSKVATSNTVAQKANSH
jgi:hypothetical protein